VLATRHAGYRHDNAPHRRRQDKEDVVYIGLGTLVLIIILILLFA